MKLGTKKRQNVAFIRPKEKMSKKYRWGMVIDLDKCTGCQSCVVACKQENNVPFSNPEQASKGRTISWLKVLSVVVGEFPDIRMRNLPLLCMHCQNPPCVKVCPVEATFLGEEGIVGQIYNRCIGCRYCMNGCPYSIKFFNWFEPDVPQDLKNAFNPDVSARPKGVVEKCTFCHHRMQKAKEAADKEKRDVQDGDYVPSCVQSCPAGAMTFGNLLDKDSAVSKLANGPRAFRLMEELGTEPHIFYLSEGDWLEKKTEFPR